MDTDKINQALRRTFEAVFGEGLIREGRAPVCATRYYGPRIDGMVAPLLVEDETSEAEGHFLELHLTRDFATFLFMLDQDDLENVSAPRILASTENGAANGYQYIWAMSEWDDADMPLPEGLS